MHGRMDITDALRECHGAETHMPGGHASTRRRICPAGVSWHADARISDVCHPGNLDAETHMPGRAYLGIKKGEDNGCCLHLILINRLLDYQSGFCSRLGFLSISLSGMGQR